MSNFAELKQKMKTLRKEMKEAAKTFFKKESQHLFEEFPYLKSFRWRQYTPYFNDGDECTFSAHNDYPTINEDMEEAFDQDYGICPKCKKTFAKKEWTGEQNEKNEYVYKYPKKCDVDGAEIDFAGVKKMTSALKKFLKSFSDDDYKEMFGDHCEVTVTRKGVKIGDCDHD